MRPVCHVAPIHALSRTVAEQLDGSRPAWSYVAPNKVPEPKPGISDVTFIQPPNLMSYIVLESASILHLGRFRLVLGGFLVD